MHFSSLQGCGLGLRSEFSKTFLASPAPLVDILEITPENWMGAKGWRQEQLYDCAKQYPLIAHGLSLSVGGSAAIDGLFVDQLAAFFEIYGIEHYSEHLSFCKDESGYLYDLLPIPFTEAAVEAIASRIIDIQQRLGMKIALENSSYYTLPEQQLKENVFINTLLEAADCLMLLDVNNVYVNSCNHHYDPKAYIASLPSERIAYLHIAGHWQKQSDLIIDTHGAPVIDPVWELLQYTYECHGLKPTILERDSDIPPLAELLAEVAHIKRIQDALKVAS